MERRTAAQEFFHEILESHKRGIHHPGGDKMHFHLRKSVWLKIFTLVSSFLFSAVASAEPGVTADSILIGQSAGFTATTANEVREMTEGAKLYFEEVNKQGGVGGRKIVLESMDDGFDGKRAGENTKKLIYEKNVFALFLYRGTPTTEAAMAVIRDAKVPLIASSSGAYSLHEPMQRYMFNVRAKFRDEVGMMVRQISTMGMQRLAVFAANDTFGKDCIEGLKVAVNANKLPDPLITTYERNTVVVGDAVTKIIAAQPQAVLMFCTAKSCDTFIREFRKAGGNQMIFTLSNTSSKAFLDGLGPLSRGLGMTQVFPSPKNTTVGISKEFTNATKTRPELADSYIAFEGFISAKVLTEGLRRAGPNLTREKLVAALETLKGVNLGGIGVNYSPTSRQGSDYVELTVIGKNGVVMH
jgi:ABC-type branched-subunit amino acid transport system substrate-binding protein